MHAYKTFYHIFLINMFRSIRVALQEYSEYNKLPNCVCGTPRHYNRCLKLSIWSQNVSLYIIKNR